MMRRTHSSSDQDSLDALLAQARWPEPSKDSAGRLATTWSDLTQRPIWRIPMWRPILAAAAVVMVAFGIASILMRPKQIAPVAMIKSVAKPDAPSAIVGREPTEREWIFIRAAEREEHRVRTAATIPAAPHVNPTPAAPSETTLAQQIERSDGPVNPVLARQFADVAGPRSLPLILHLWHDAKLRPATVDALARLGDAATLATAAHEADSQDLRGKLISGLLDRQSPQALSKYLELVADARTRPAALNAIEGRKNPPTDALMAILSSPRADLRPAAAWALGRIDGPTTTRRLIHLIDAGQSQQEAFIALASSRGQDAQTFLHQAVASDRFASWARSAIAQTETQQTEIQ